MRKIILLLIVMVLPCKIEAADIKISARTQQASIGKIKVFSDLFIVTGRPYSTVKRMKSLEVDKKWANFRQIEENDVIEYVKQELRDSNISISWLGAKTINLLPQKGISNISCKEMKAALYKKISMMSSDDFSVKAELDCGQEIFSKKTVDHISVKPFFLKRSELKHPVMFVVSYKDGAVNEVVRWAKFIAYKRVYVVSSDINKGETLSYKNINVEIRNIPYGAADALPLNSDVENYKALSRLYVGDYLTVKNTINDSWVQSGENVKLILQENGVLIETVAQALENGKSGDVIDVKIPQSVNVLHARVLDGGVCELL